MKRLLLALAAAALIGAHGPAGAQEATASDTTAAAMTAARDSAQKKKSLGKKLLDYFSNANKGKSDKKFDFSILGGPHFNTNTKLGLGLVAAGLYSTDRPTRC